MQEETEEEHKESYEEYFFNGEKEDIKIIVKDFQTKEVMGEFKREATFDALYIG